jgi:predicted MFS family arabinose efflux permease
VLSLNSAVTYAGTFLGAGRLGQVHEAWGSAPVASMASACFAVAALIAWQAHRDEG